MSQRWTRNSNHSSVTSKLCYISTNMKQVVSSVSAYSALVFFLLVFLNSARRFFFNFRHCLGSHSKFESRVKLEIGSASSCRIIRYLLRRSHDVFRHLSRHSITRAKCQVTATVLSLFLHSESILNTDWWNSATASNKRPTGGLLIFYLL